MGLPANLQSQKPKHDDEGVDITPGLEFIQEAAPPVQTDKRGIPVGVNKAGPLEPRRVQVIPYLITGGVTVGIVPDHKRGFVFPDIRLQPFVANYDGVKTKELRAGEQAEKGPPKLLLKGKAQKLQINNNFPVHTVIGYPSALWVGRKGQEKPSEDDIFRMSGHGDLLRKYQRQFLRFEVMERFNLIQEAGGNAFRLRWAEETDFVRDAVLGPLTTDLATLQNAGLDKPASDYEQKTQAVVRDLDTVLANLKAHLQWYEDRVNDGEESIAVLNRMAANRARTVSKENPWGDPTADLPAKSDDSRKTASKAS